MWLPWLWLPVTALLVKAQNVYGLSLCDLSLFLIRNPQVPCHLPIPVLRLKKTSIPVMNLNLQVRCLDSHSLYISWH